MPLVLRALEAVQRRRAQAYAKQLGMRSHSNNGDGHAEFQQLLKRLKPGVVE
ncbi:MAG: hypothetical protein GY792_18975 [Gammaproteobacteria bacterium]|nr:hypothetical protein [Gammaproteobacteria bacterium]